MNNTTQIAGACHCGNIAFELQWPTTKSEINVRTCGCTFCKKHGGSWTSNPRSTLDIEIENPLQVSKYTFGTKTADFYVCSVCGVVPFVLSEIDHRNYAVVNVNAFVNTKDLSMTAGATDFDGEDIDSRLLRRKQNWIANVSFTPAEETSKG